MKLGLHTTSMTSKKNLGQKIFLTPQGGFCTQKTPFWLKNGLLSLYLPNAAIIFPNFWYGSFSFGLLWENHTLYAGKILIWRIFGPPQRGWDLWFSLRSFVRPSVCPFVRERSQNQFIGIFWFLAESWGFLMRRKWHFRIVPQKSRPASFGPI